VSVAEENPGSVVVTIIPDGAARYLDILLR
jgi:cysteine synthase